MGGDFEENMPHMQNVPCKIAEKWLKTALIPVFKSVRSAQHFRIDDPASMHVLNTTHIG